MVLQVYVPTGSANLAYSPPAQIQFVLVLLQALSVSRQEKKLRKRARGLMSA
jgi:hypothetical protein